MRLRRDSTLNRWLQFWQENEAKVRQKIRQGDCRSDVMCLEVSWLHFRSLEGVPLGVVSFTYQV